MKFLILLAVVAAASAVPLFPYKDNFYGEYKYGHYLPEEFKYGHYYPEQYKFGHYYPKEFTYGVTPKFDYYTMMTGGHHGLLDREITVVKKDFIVFYYKYLVDLLDIFKTRFHDLFEHVDFKESYPMPIYCKKMTGMMQWMMMMNIDFTKYDPHYFDMFMWCKISDYMMFMKYYWLHFDFSEVMHKDLPFMKELFYGFGDHGKFLHKFGDFYGKKYDGFYGKDLIYGKHFEGIYPGYKMFPETYYGEYKYGVTPKFDYYTMMTGGHRGFLEKDITVVKKDFIVFYYKFLVDLLDIFKTRFSDILVHVDSHDIDTLTLPLYCKKVSGLMSWMMTMKIDFTKYDPHYFDLFMWCKISDYMMFMKYYWLHFNYSDVMHKDISFMRDLYPLLGQKFLYKFGDFYGKKYDGFYGKDFDFYGKHYEGFYPGYKMFPQKYYGEYKFENVLPYYHY